MGVENIRKTVGVALSVCLVCSILVSTSVITLRKKQDRNKKIERLRNILVAGNLLEEGKDIEKKFHDNIKSVYIELETGRELAEAGKPGQIKKIPKNGLPGRIRPGRYCFNKWSDLTF